MSGSFYFKCLVNLILFNNDLSLLTQITIYFVRFVSHKIVYASYYFYIFINKLTLDLSFVCSCFFGSTSCSISLCFCYLHSHNLIDWSTLPVQTKGAFLCMSIDVTKCKWASRVLLFRFVFNSHIRRVLSSLTLSKNLPPGWNISPLIQLLWPIRVNRHCNVVTSQIFIVLSLEPEQRYGPLVRCCVWISCFLAFISLKNY